MNLRNHLPEREGTNNLVEEIAVDERGVADEAGESVANVAVPYTGERRPGSVEGSWSLPSELVLIDIDERT